MLCNKVLKFYLSQLNTTPLNILHYFIFPRFCAIGVLLVFLVYSGLLYADPDIEITGLETAQEDNVRAYLSLSKEDCESPDWKIKRLFKQAPVQIQQALDLILKNSTSILIAHRLSTIKAADRIIVLEDGGIIEEGNHETLLATNGHYANLYNTYFRHQSLAYVEGSREMFAID